MRDQVFKDEIPRAKDFAFNAGVANVFDDMVNRSVPFYEEIQRMIAELAADHAAPFTNVYDLGCSTGTTIANMSNLLKPDVRVIGVDDSAEMLKKCGSKLDQTSLCNAYELQCTDISEELRLNNASVAICA